MSGLGAAIDVQGLAGPCVGRLPKDAWRADSIRDKIGIEGNGTPPH
jgi:hypothetical protein